MQHKDGNNLNSVRKIRVIYAAFLHQKQFESFSNQHAIPAKQQFSLKIDKLPDLAPSGLVKWQYPVAILTVVEQCSH